MHEDYADPGFLNLLTHLRSQAKVDAELTHIDHKRLTIKPKASLQFPAGDIAEIMDDGQNVTIVCHFLGLYGVDSPLPMYFNQLCLSEDGEVFRDFLDIFHHRHYVQYYLAWEAFTPEAMKHSRFADYGAFIKALEGFTSHYDGRILSDVDYLNQDNLSWALNKLLPGIPCAILPTCPQWHAIEQPMKLDQSLELGQNSILGERFLDACGEVVIHIGPLSGMAASCLQVNKDKYAGLNRLFSNIILYWLNVKVHIEIVPQATIGLGDNRALLGWETWLGAANTVSYVTLAFSHS